MLNFLFDMDSNLGSFESGRFAGRVRLGHEVGHHEVWDLPGAPEVRVELVHRGWIRPLTLENHLSTWAGSKSVQTGTWLSAATWQLG